MKIIKTVAASSLAAFSFMAAMAVIATPANAQATRTWVSGVGDDVNPCSRTAPCKTFAGAISKTAAGGEINCLDPGGFGAVTITKSITIDCEDTQGSILASNVNGVIVNAANVKVVLRGLSINGANSTTGNGVRFLLGASLTIDKLIIQNHAGTGVNGAGILFQPSSVAELYVIDSVIVNGGSIGIDLAPTAGGSVTAVMRNTRVLNYGSTGVRLNSASGAVLATISESEISNNAAGILASATSTANLMLVDSSVSNNTGIGISGSGVNARLLVGRSTITGNGTGISIAGGSLVNTYGNNFLNRNTVDGAFTPGPIATL